MEPALKLPVCEYKRREPEQTLLHTALCAHLETFLDRVRTEAFNLPKHVARRRASRYGAVFDVRN